MVEVNTVLVLVSGEVLMVMRQTKRLRVGYSRVVVFAIVVTMLCINVCRTNC